MLNMIVCVAKDNLIGDKNPKGNGLLWHSKEELQYFKKITGNGVLLFGKNTANVVPLEILKKTREVVVLNRETNIDELLRKYQDKEIFICGGATIYEYFLKNFKIDNIYVSLLKEKVEVAKPLEPLYFPDVTKFGYSCKSSVIYDDFVAKIYRNE